MDTWEPALIRLAHEALRSPVLLPAQQNATRTELAEAHAHCERVTAQHSRSFSLASSLLPEPKRSAIRALYVFCRTADDSVDRPNLTGAHTWDWWMDQAAQKGAPREHHLAALAWWDTCVRFGIPALAVDQLLAGVRCDLERVNYQTFDELAHYCYGVASTVGLLSMHIIGYGGPDAIPYAVRLGVALQLTNILRDIGKDLANRRLYLPQDELAFFGVRREELARGQVTAAWRRLMRFQIDRSRELYDRAVPGIGLLHPDGELAVAAAAEFYRGILSLITSVNATIAADIEWRVYDSRLGLQSVARIGLIEDTLAGAPDAQSHELWLGRGALLNRDGREVRDSAGLGAALIGVPVDGRLYRPNIVAGRWFSAEDVEQNVIVLNAQTAADNGLGLGDTIDIDLGAAPARVWRIIGLYRVVTGANFTTEEVYAPFPAMASAAAVPDGANVVLVRTGATVLEQAQAASDRIETRLTDAGLPLEAFTTLIKLEERDFANNQFAPTVSMFLGLASLVATVGGIGLMRALVLGVLERRREIGVLRAIGVRSPTIASLFMLEGVSIDLLSWVLAVSLSIVLAPPLAEQLGLTMLELQLDYLFDWNAIWIWLAVVIVTGLLYSAGPALAAARVSVREALAYS